MNKMNSFVKQFVALVNGDDVEVQAQKAWRGAESALKVQIASKEGDTVTLEDDVDKAKENLESSRVNHGKNITDRVQYIDNLIVAKNRLTEAEEKLESHNAELDFLREEYSSLQTEG